jgi:hypothetical protein
VTTVQSVGHKLSASAGILFDNPNDPTEYQNDRCRHKYSQVVSKYVYRATTNTPTHTFYAICGKINGPMNVKRIDIPQAAGAFPASCDAVPCFGPFNATEQACFPPTAAPTPEPPGTAVNNSGKSRGAASQHYASFLALLLAFVAFLANI